MLPYSHNQQSAAQHRQQGFSKRQMILMHVRYKICDYSERVIKGKKQNANHKDQKSRDKVELSKRHSSSQSAGQHAGRRETSILETLFWFVLISCSFVTIYPVVSLWKPGVPYPVHGRVLVEIQRPRSLHRKAVIQLNTKRNQHNQSKYQFI